MLRGDNEIRTKIRRFILDHFPAARSQPLLDEDALLGSHIVDSMGVLELVTFIEAEFGITVEDDDLLPDNFQSISRVAGFVETKSDNRPLHQDQ